MSSPYAEGGPLPPPNRALIAEHERRLALAFPPDGTIRVLSVVKDGEVWHVDLDVAPVADETRGPGDPNAVRLHIETDLDTDEGVARADLPVEVLQRIAERIREL